MFLFYNQSDKVIQGFSINQFNSTNSDFDSEVHTQYEGEFKIPEVLFEYESEEQTAIENQTIFTLTTMEYDNTVDELNVAINGDMVSSELYSKTSTTIITFSEELNESDNVIFGNSKKVFYLFNTETETFSRIY